MTSAFAFLGWTCAIGLVCLTGVWAAARIEDHYATKNSAVRWPRPRRLP